jgi:hypothetical protein
MMWKNDRILPPRWILPGWSYQASSSASGLKKATRAPKNDVSNARRFFLLSWDNAAVEGYLIFSLIIFEEPRNVPS